MTQAQNQNQPRTYITIKCLDNDRWGKPGKVIDYSRPTCPSLNRDVIRIETDSLETEVIAKPCQFNRFVVLGKIENGARPCDVSDPKRGVVYMPLVDEEKLGDWIKESLTKYEGDLQKAVDCMPDWNGNHPVVPTKHEPVFVILSKHAHYMVGPWSWKGSLHATVSDKALNEIAAVYNIDLSAYRPKRVMGKNGPEMKNTYGSIFNWVNSQLRMQEKPELVTDPVFIRS